MWAEEDGRRKKKGFQIKQKSSKSSAQQRDISASQLSSIFCVRYYVNNQQRGPCPLGHHHDVDPAGCWPRAGHSGGNLRFLGAGHSGFHVTLMTTL